MMNWITIKIATLAAVLFFNTSPWVTVVDTYYFVSDGEHSMYEYRHPANEDSSNYCYIHEVTEEIDENGVVWTVYHCGAKTVDD